MSSQWRSLFLILAISCTYVTTQSYDQFSSYDQSKNCVSTCVNGACSYSCASGSPNGASVCTQCINGDCTVTNCNGGLIRKLTPEESRRLIEENKAKAAETTRNIQLQNQRMQNQLHANFQRFQNQFHQNMQNMQRQMQQQFGGNVPFGNHFY
ncbi:hypothetical protein CHUAL_004916 [Chamberlinius hualienensis]